MLPRAATTLAEHLRAAGWTTSAVVSHSFCGSDWGFAQGFDSFDESNVLGHLGVSSPGVTEGGLRFLDEHKHERFFLWLHYFDPHYVYKLHPGHDPDPGSDYDGRVVDGMYISALEALTGTLTPDDRAQLARLYDSEIAFTDAQIGRVLDRLEALGLADDTVVVFVADHGEAFDEHGLIGHASTLYQELVHVPFLVRCPRWAPGEVSTPVSSVDLFPTILSCLDLPGPGGLVGRSLAPDAPAATEPRLLFSQTSRGGRQVAVRSGDHKLIARLARGRAPRLELYDLSADPHEAHDLAPQGGPILEQLSRELLSWEEATREGAMAPETIDVDAWLQENLEALGYTED
ncbi:MAG TPA: hypothetical protein ENK18_24995 [Deltaproteobacteria bacterium]|nr:hypothetical protein [Deltaproteobacteria bacterium]